MGEKQWRLRRVWRPCGWTATPRRGGRVRQQYHCEDVHRGRVRQHHGGGGEQHAGVFRVPAL